MKYPTALIVAVLTSSVIGAAVDFDKLLLKPRALSRAEDVGSYSSNSPSTVDVDTDFTRAASRLQTRDEDEHGSKLSTKELSTKEKKPNLKKAFGHIEKSVESAALRRNANQQAAESLKAACGQLLCFNLKECRERLGQAWKFAEDDAYHQRDCYHHIKKGAGYVLKALAEDDCPPPGSSASQTTTSSSSPDSQSLRDTQPSRRPRQRRGRDRTPKPTMQNDDGYVSVQSLPPPPIGTQTGLGSPPTSNPSEDNIHQRRHYEEEEITFREVASDIRRRHVSRGTLSTRAVKIEELD